MSIRAMVFDLFDTLVDLHFDASDTTEVAGKQVHSFVLRLHEALRERAEVDFESFMKAVTEVDRTEGRPRYKEGREFPTLERFESVVRLLGLEDPELPEILTDAHMSGNGRWRILGAADDAKGQHEKPFHTARVIPLEVAVNEPASAARIPAKTGSRWTAKRRGGRLALCRLEDAAEAAPVRSP